MGCRLPFCFSARFSLSPVPCRRAFASFSFTHPTKHYLSCPFSRSASTSPSSSSSSQACSSSSSPPSPSLIKYSSSDSGTHRTAPHSFDSIHDHTDSPDAAVAFELPIGPSKHDERIRQITGANPLKYDLPGAIDAIFRFQQRGYLVFPEYMHVELKKRVIATVKSKVNLLRAQAIKITQDKVDEFLIDALHRDGVALAQNEDDAVHVLVSETPRIGDERELEGKPSKVIRRYLVHDNGATRVVLESQLLPPAPADTIIKEYFTVADASEPPPVMSEAERNQKIAAISSMELEQGSRPTRDIAYTQADVDRVLHEELLGKEMPTNQTPEEQLQTRAAMEEALFADDIKAQAANEPIQEGLLDFVINQEIAASRKK